jgi:hypothetical protein
MTRFALLLTFFPAWVVHGQLAQFGIKGAIPVLNTFPGAGDESKRYNVGPSVEFRLRGGFAIEADALYQRVGESGHFQFAGEIPSGAGTTSFTPGPFAGAYYARARGDSWQFPVLAKRYFRMRSSVWQPFVSLGPSVRRVKSESDTNEIFFDSSGRKDFPGHAEPSSNWSIGGTVAAGARLRAGRFAIVPEFRYTRWAQNNGSALSRNAASAFLGFSF